ncbi:MAG: IS200/IS605 family element transposase accessory protein TnpB [Candidatus Aenigmarchaeota archaeon]|nr:IS200/IS605 family element transposase accessory protein TnpB [Candidatus Aenigmarchaeota archaeon]
MQRTISLKIPCEESLKKTMQIYNRAVQDCIDIGWEMKTFNKNELHENSYRLLRKAYPSLQSSLVQCARDQASDILKRSGFEKRKPVKRLNGSIRYNARTYTPKLKDGIISVSTIEGRKKFRVDVPNHFKKYTKGIVKGMVLVQRNGFFLVKLVVELEDKQFKYKKVRTLGIDCGINKIAVCSDNTFYASKHLKGRKGEFFYLREKLQQRGTRSAKRLLRKISGRENRFVADVNHQISKAIVNSRYNTFVFEKLSVRKNRKFGRKFNKKLGSWSFRKLQTFVEYKAKEIGKQITFVNPAYTSQTCSVCATTQKSFRHGNFFSCSKCGLNLDADLNASRNIAMLGNALLGRASVNSPDVSCDDVAGAKAQLQQSIVTSHLTC